MTHESRMTMPQPRDGIAMRAVKGLIVATLLVHVVFGATSAYRAWVQVRDVRVAVTGDALRVGDTVRAGIVSSGRNSVTLVVELVQGALAETLAVRVLPKNGEPFWDPRARRESVAVVLTPVALARFHAGGAQLRATGVGRAEWGRTPPPVVRTVAVSLAHGR